MLFLEYPLTPKLESPIAIVTSQTTSAISSSQVFPFRTAADLLDNPSRFATGAWARDTHYRPVPVFSHEAVQWSVLGAIHRIYSNRDQRLDLRFQIAFYLKHNSLLPARLNDIVIGTVKSAGDLIQAWECHPTTVHPEIYEALATLAI